jgi:hypothetical protein
MGISPGDVKKMTVWEFVAVADIWSAAHEVEQPGSRLSDTDKGEIWDWMQKQDSPVNRAAARRTNGHRHR